MKLLVVDDEIKILNVIKLLFHKENCQVDSASSGEEALELVEDNSYDVILLDLNLPGIDGLETMKKIRFSDKYCNTQFVIITAHGSFRTAVEAIKNGAYNYISKPFDNDELIAIVKGAAKAKFLSDKIDFLENEISNNEPLNNIIGNSDEMHNVFRLVEKIAPADCPVLITGESGTGKELIVKALYNLSKKYKSSFIPVNCSAISPTLFESEFFGFSKGAFTGANITKKGKFREADQGVLFLDEIAEMPLEFQPKLLRALESGEVIPVGESRPFSVDVRIICATNKNLYNLVNEGKFREDLYYRLNVFQITLPPLRSRGEDIVLLIKYFCKKYGCKEISDEALKILCNYNWPGNVRELKHEIQKASILADDIIMVNHLSERIRNFHGTKKNNAETTAIDINDNFSMEEYIESVERKLMLKALKKQRYNKSNASRMLGLSYRVFNYKFEKYGMEEEMR